MEISTLLEVQNEAVRFMTKLEAAIKRSQENKGYTSNYGGSKGQLIGVGEINGTKESGAVKRAALDLKNELTKITK